MASSPVLDPSHLTLNQFYFTCCKHEMGCDRKECECAEDESSCRQNCICRRERCDCKDICYSDCTCVTSKQMCLDSCGCQPKCQNRLDGLKRPRLVEEKVVCIAGQDIKKRAWLGDYQGNVCRRPEWEESNAGIPIPYLRFSKGNHLCFAESGRQPI